MTAINRIRLRRLIWMLNRLAAGLAITLVRSYQLLLAPIWIGGCRHLPTCSEYAIDSFRVYGIWRGIPRAFSRIFRCRPGGSFGYDPVEHDN